MSIDTLGIVAIPVITVIVFLIGEAVKLTPLDEKWIPVICGASGGILGVVAKYVMPDFPATDVLTADLKTLTRTSRNVLIARAPRLTSSSVSPATS